MAPNPSCQPLPFGFGFSWPGQTLQAGWTVGECSCSPSGPSPHVLQKNIQVLTHFVCLQTKGAVVNYLYPRPGSSGVRETHAVTQGGLGRHRLRFPSALQSPAPALEPASGADKPPQKARERFAETCPYQTKQAVAEALRVTPHGGWVGFLCLDRS